MAKNNESGSRRMRRWLIVAGILLAVIALGVSLSRPEAVGVEVVSRQALDITVSEQGRTRAREPYIVAAPVYGQLMRTELIEGDAVEAGQVLAGIAVAPENQRDRAVLEASLSAARAREQAAG